MALERLACAPSTIKNRSNVGTLAHATISGQFQHSDLIRPYPAHVRFRDGSVKLRTSSLTAGTRLNRLECPLARRSRGVDPLPKRYVLVRGLRCVAAAIFSLVANCQRHDIDPYIYLRDVLKRLPLCPISRVVQFLSDQWEMDAQ